MAATATEQPLSSHFEHLNISPAQQSKPLTSEAMAEKTYQPRNVSTTMFYHKPNEDGSPPEPAYIGKPEPVRLKEEVPVTVYDIRGRESDYSLDKTGFQIVKHKTAVMDWTDDQHIKDVYYPECEKILKEATGAHRVLIFNHLIRGDAVSPHKPVQSVHIDQSYVGGKARATHHVGKDYPELLEGRYQTINVWRPFKTVKKDPLAVCDSRSVADDSLVGIGLIFPDYRGELCAVKKWADGAKEHKWHYLNEQGPDEVMLIKCFDSKTDCEARRAPHTAFVDKEREGEEDRQSIEIRSLVFSDY